MTSHKKISFSLDQQSHLDAWAAVYVEARIQQKLGIGLSRFLRNPGDYLLIVWLKTTQHVNCNGYLPLLPAQVAVSERIHQRWNDQESQ